MREKRVALAGWAVVLAVLVLTVAWVVMVHLKMGTNQAPARTSHLNVETLSAEQRGQLRELLRLSALIEGEVGKIGAAEVPEGSLLKEYQEKLAELTE